ncbi:MAG: PrsW family glutamic-type intramembrane protease [Planctomycetota bacterium]
MQYLRILLGASAPALFWLWLFWKRDRWQREPKLVVLKLYVLGALVAAPAYFLEMAIPLPGDGWTARLYDNFVRIAFVEEAAKFAIVWIFAYRHREFDEPMDGIVYGTAVALGFATVENVLYALWLNEGILLQRAFTATLAHVGFTGIIGYHFGFALLKPPHERRLYKFRGLLFAVLAHGVYDVLVTAPNADLVPRLTVLLGIPALLINLSLLANRADSASPFRTDASAPADGDTDKDTDGERL